MIASYIKRLYLAAMLAAFFIVSSAARAETAPITSQRFVRMPQLETIAAHPVTQSIPVERVRAPLNIIVNTTQDSLDANPQDSLCADLNGTCSLRAAVMQANENPGSTITLGPGIYMLTRTGPDENVSTLGDLDVLSAMTIIGAGAGQTIIDGSSADRIFDVIGSSGFNLSGVTLTHGRVSASGTTNPPGGAIWINSASTATLERLLIVESSAVYGGGISIEGLGTTVTLRDSAIVNTSAQIGGGIDIYSASQVDLYNVTISAAIASDGGGLSADSTTLTTVNLNNVTLAANQATSNGGGLFNARAVVNLSNSILATNTAAGAANDCAGSVNTTGSNLFSTNQGCTLSLDTDLISNAPGLRELALYPPGETPTHSLTTDSPAVDAGDSSACLPTDQRGVLRPQGSGCDIGAFELRDQDRDLPLVFDLIAPLDGAFYTSAANLIDFRWQPSQFATSYTVIVSPTQNASQPAYEISGTASELCAETVCTLTPDTGIEAVLSSGVYQWTVRAENSGGSTLASTTHTLTIDPQALNLLINGDFEQHMQVDGRNMPELWTGEDLADRDGLFRNKINRPGRPDKVFAYEGSRAFRFAGAAPQNRRLKQKLTTFNSEIASVAPGDTLLLQGFALGDAVPADAAGIVVRVVFDVIDPATGRPLRSAVISQPLPSGTYWDTHRAFQARAVIPTEVNGMQVNSIRRIIVLVRYANPEPGRVFVDALSLLALDADDPLNQPVNLPLPAETDRTAPEDLIPSGALSGRQTR